MNTLAALIDRHAIDVLDHLDREALVPVLSGLQFQGDVAVIPPVGPVASTPVPAAGLPVVRGEAGGNTHTLLGEGPVMFDAARPGGQELGLLTVPEGSVAYLAHPEHAYTGIAAGSYVVRRQREMADELRLVAD